MLLIQEFLVRWLVNVITSEARLKGRKSSLGCRTTKRERRIASWEDPQPSTPLFPSHRTSRHRNIDVPPTILHLCFIHNGSTPLSVKLHARIWRSFNPLLFLEYSAISLRRKLNSEALFSLLETWKIFLLFLHCYFLLNFEDIFVK